MQDPAEHLNTDRLSAEFIRKHPGTCAAAVITGKQKIFYLTVFCLALLLLFYRWDLLIFLLTALLAFLYLSAAFFRLVAAVSGFFFRYERADIPEGELPIYTILLPMYKEANIAEQLIDRIRAIDYPLERLDVKILLEQDDTATIEAMRSLNLPEQFEILVMDPCLPKTKPRACNYGLEKARGEFCVIYDAEDRPEPDQLKKAVGMFRGEGREDVACVQAKLNYHNSRQNLLTRLFTIEYTTHFDLILPGMQLFNFPLPLGGTSNHFRTEILKQIGGWDSFNVTEDCDLGIRIYENRYRTLLLDSTTWEEANSRLGNWIRQRSRWIKGFFQTHLVHYRSWFSTIGRLGLWGSFGGFLAIGGGSLMILCNIIFMLLLLGYCALLLAGSLQGVPVMDQIVVSTDNMFLHTEVFWKAWPLVYFGADESMLYSILSMIFASVSFLLFCANFVFLAIGMLGCFKRKYWHLILYTPLMFIYWQFMSIAAWKGFLQLFYKPFYWEKTKHGLQSDSQK